MLAVRVPPSAWITSQSRWIVRSPSCVRSTTARSARPISRWISCVRPDCLPRAASRSVRVLVERGSMPYSAVTQPCGCAFQVRRLPLEHARGADAPCVSPNSTSTEPSACRV